MRRAGYRKRGAARPPRVSWSRVRAAAGQPPGEVDAVVGTWSWFGLSSANRRSRRRLRCCSLLSRRLSLSSRLVLFVRAWAAASSAADPSPPGRQARPPRVSVAGRNLEGRTDPPLRRQPERTAPLGGSRAPRAPRRLALPRRLRAPARRACLPGHHGRDAGGREHGRRESGPQATRDPRTPG